MPAHQKVRAEEKGGGEKALRWLIRNGLVEESGRTTPGETILHWKIAIVCRETR